MCIERKFSTSESKWNYAGTPKCSSKERRVCVDGRKMDWNYLIVTSCIPTSRHNTSIRSGFRCFLIFFSEQKNGENSMGIVNPLVVDGKKVKQINKYNEKK